MTKYHFYNKPCKSAILALGILFTVNLTSSLLQVPIQDMKFSQHWKVTLCNILHHTDCILDKLYGLFFVLFVFVCVCVFWGFFC
jgi:hypothetical protein